MRELVVCLLGVVGACTAEVSEPRGFVDHGDPARGREFAPVPATLHRLTVDEYRNSLRDLLPAAVAIPTELEPDTPLHGYASVGASDLTISPRAAELYEAAAFSIGEQIFQEPTMRGAFVGCEPADIADPCVGTFLRSFARRAWRRSPTEDEVASLATLAQTIATDLASPWRGLEFAMMAVLQSPSFLFRVERGEPDPDHPGWLRYTSVEMASRLSYFIWGSIPDEPLLAAGENGELVTEDGIRREVERMLDSPKAEAALTAWFGEYATIDRVLSVSKDGTLFPELTPTLREAMRREIELVFAEQAFNPDADFRFVFRTDRVFVNDELAAIYGVPAPGVTGLDLVAANLSPDDARGGIVARAGLLTQFAAATRTSPTFRGKFIRSMVLCEDVPPPPPGVNTELAMETGMGPRTLRQRLEEHATNPTCATCHNAMDPLGFALEHYDAVGRWRDLEDGLTIDASGDLDGTPIDGAGDLGEALADDPRVAECLARQLYRFATGHLEEFSEEPAIDALGERFAERGYRFRELVIELVLTDGFRSAQGDAR
jgi:PAS domain-containing protein